MKSAIINVIKFTVLAGLMGWLMWSSYNSIDAEVLLPGETRWGFIVRTWNESNQFWLFMSVVIGLASHWVRAMRWKVLLRPLGYGDISMWNSFMAVMNGYFVNLAIPRGGEVSRPMTLNRIEKVPTDQGLGTVVVERVVDLILLLVCIGTVFIFQLTRFSEFMSEAVKGGEPQAEGGISKWVWVLAVLAGLAIIYFVFKAVKPELFAKVSTKAKGFLHGMKSGLQSIFKMKQKVLFLWHSLLIYILYFLMGWAVMLAFPETREYGAMEALTLFVIGGISMALPLPNGTGTYHKLVPLGLVMLCGLEDLSKGVAFAWIFHGLHTFIFITVGGLGLLYINKKAAQVKNAQSSQQDSGAVASQGA